LAIYKVPDFDKVGIDFDQAITTSVMRHVMVSSINVRRNEQLK
jgi:hypothetical protein